ncbi:hypothetical protein EIP91_009843, partial [Steccherinum ochraceum]
PVTRNDPPRLHAIKPHPRMRLLHLQEISVSADGRALMDIAKWLLLTPSPYSLKKLVFEVLTDDFKYTRLVKLSLGRVMRGCGPSVEEIELTINAEWIRKDDQFTLEWNTNLRSLQLELSAHVMQTDGISWLARLFHTISSASFESLTLICLVDSDRGIFTSASWSELDASIIALQLRSQLRIVTMNSVAGTPGKSTSTAWDFSSKLPRTSPLKLRRRISGGKPINRSLPPDHLAENVRPPQTHHLYLQS